MKSICLPRFSLWDCSNGNSNNNKKLKMISGKGYCCLETRVYVKENDSEICYWGRWSDLGEEVTLELRTEEWGTGGVPGSGTTGQRPWGHVKCWLFQKLHGPQLNPFSFCLWASFTPSVKWKESQKLRVSLQVLPAHSNNYSFIRLTLPLPSQIPCSPGQRVCMSSPILCDPMDCSLPDSSVHGIS